MTDDTTDPTVCQMAGFTSVIGGRWKLGILCTLTTSGKARFNELVERLDPITPTTLTRQLRELERDGLVNRTQYNEIPPRVEYAATEMSATLGPVLATIAEWVQTHAPQRSTMTETARNEIGQPV
ncbi:MAG: DNA-binding HxlR family transcriptional regulator [Ilumatobacter sp.]|jgi:DNA-binding HxlR family transcriptional regulator